MCRLRRRLAAFISSAPRTRRSSGPPSALRALGVRHLLGAHCTGIEAVFRLRQLVGLARSTAVVGAVGSAFTLGKGIESPPLAR